MRNTDDVYTFTFSYTNDKEAKQTFKHTFKNKHVTAKISLQKQDKETKKQFHRGMPLWKKQFMDCMLVRILCIRTVLLV